MLPLLFLGMKRYAPSLQAMYPQQCTFLIDEQFSGVFQTALQVYVDEKYSSCKDMQQILDEVFLHFPEVRSMDACVQKADKVCFTFEAVHPLFVLNDSIVGDNLRLMSKDHYNRDILEHLHTITATLPCDVGAIVDFFQQVPDSVFKDFHVHLNSSDEIVLSQKRGGMHELLFCMSNKPTLQAISIFEKIKQRKDNKKKQIFDFRFNNQIIIK